LGIGQIFAGHSREAFAYFLHEGIGGGIFTDRRFLFQLIEARQAKLHLLAAGNEIQLMPASFRSRCATGKAEKRRKNARNPQYFLHERNQTYLIRVRDGVDN